MYQLYTLIVQMNNLVEIKIVMFEPYRTKSYQEKLTAKKT